MDDSRKYLDALLVHLDMTGQDHMKWQAQKNRELGQKNKELDQKKNELAQKNKELEDQSQDVKSLMAAYKKHVSAMAAIRIYAAIEHEVKRHSWHKATQWCIVRRFLRPYTIAGGLDRKSAN
jgi:septal ring factor EnvC (AmiA/AmiB activator)